MVGKTRMATTLIKELYPARRIVVPESKNSLASLGASDLTLRSAVIFLDDINRLIEKHYLNMALDDQIIFDRVCRAGLGEYVGAAERIAEALDLGPLVSPVGYALVLGAASWHLVGMNGPVPSHLLPELAAPYLIPPRSADLSDSGTYSSALEWATREITLRGDWRSVQPGARRRSPGYPGASREFGDRLLPGGSAQRCDDAAA